MTDSTPSTSLFAGLTGADTLYEFYLSFLKKLENYLEESDIAAITEAVVYGAKAHEGQMRESGEPYFVHPIAVAEILAIQRFSVPVLQAALLHDVLEDTPVAYEEMAQAFGEEVTKLVDGVSKLDRIKNQAPQEALAESFKKMFVATTDDPRVIIIKLADRLHNMQTLGALRPDKRVRKAKETLDVYASIAGRLGLYYFREELEDLAFSNLYPWRYATIDKHYSQRYDSNEVFKRFRDRLAPVLDEMGIKNRISKRRRHLWGLYLRMKRKNSFKEACRTVPLRIVTDTEDSCYRILGKVNGLFRPISGKFEDYIAAPKSNGYRSLHVSVLMDKKDVLNIQIRTRDMHTLAEGGIISIWHQNLKLKGKGEEQHTIQSNKYMKDWLSRLREVQNITHDPLDFYDAIKNELSSGDIHVYTPKGKVIDLPRGATAVDFAYAVHTELGNQCVKAVINNVECPIYQELQIGQTCEIINVESSHPTAEWLTFVKTAKARAAINHHLRTMAERKAQAIGERYLDIALQKLGSSLERLDYAVFTDYLQKQDLDKAALYASLAQGERQPAMVATALLGHQELSDASSQIFRIHSALDSAIDFASCCYPIPHGFIVGELIPNVGVRIHRRNCPVITQSSKLDWIRVGWAKQTQGFFPVAVEIDVKERRKMLAAVVGVIADEEANFKTINIKNHLTKGDCRTIIATLEVRNRPHLAQIIRRLRSVEDVIAIRRVK